MNNKKRNIIIIVVVLLALAGLAFYMISRQAVEDAKSVTIQDLDIDNKAD